MTPPEKKHVFISHSTHDRPVVDRVLASLDAANMPYWFSKRLTDLPVGSKFAARIADAIDKSFAVILVFSKHANDSEWVQREIALAFEAGLDVYVLRIEDTKPTQDLRTYLVNRNWADAFDLDVEVVLPGLIDQLRTLLPAPTAKTVALSSDGAGANIKLDAAVSNALSKSERATLDALVPGDAPESPTPSASASAATKTAPGPQSVAPMQELAPSRPFRQWFNTKRRIMPMIFLSYRRQDTKWITERICDRLEKQFGRGSVFVDAETTEARLDFRTHIETVLRECDVMLAIIGPNWMGTAGPGQPRLFEESDWVRVEIEAALKQGIPIIPVLIDRLPMPKSEELPPSLRPLASRQSAPLDSTTDFHVHSARLILDIKRHLGWRYRLMKYRPLAAVAAFALAIGLAGNAIYSWRENLRPDTAAAIRACTIELDMRCAKRGGVFASSETLAAMRGCKNSEIVSSDRPFLRWKDVWTTDVYSYAPGGGGPGGGRDNDELRVGGWGDWYFTLIQFDLPPLKLRPQSAFIALYSKPDNAASVPLALDQIIMPWDFPKGERLWWKNRPGARAITTDPLPAPRQEQWYAIDVSNLMQQWFDGKSVNYGIQIRPASNYGTFVIFVSSDAADKSKIPRLIVCT